MYQAGMKEHVDFFCSCYVLVPGVRNCFCSCSVPVLTPKNLFSCPFIPGTKTIQAMDNNGHNLFRTSCLDVAYLYGQDYLNLEGID